ncbi:MAG: 4'-phosphopantetheinyl transferase family protein [Myxococcota bacterium]
MHPAAEPGAVAGPAGARPAEAWGLELFGAGVVVEVDDPCRPASGLFAEEAASVRRAVDLRRREFAAGRRASRRALRLLGFAPRPIVARADRLPQWPPGCVGSITHTDRWCAAAVAPSRSHRSLGLDAEPARGLDAALWSAVLTAEEGQMLRGRPPVWARLLFSAKEAAYKCQYPLTGRMLGFHDLEVRLPPTAGGGDLEAGPQTGPFEARFRVDAGPFGAGRSLPGRFMIAGGLILTAVALRR